MATSDHCAACGTRRALVAALLPTGLLATVCAACYARADSPAELVAAIERQEK